MGKLLRINGQPLGRASAPGTKVPTKLAPKAKPPAPPAIVDVPSARPYQREGALFLAKYRRALLADDMGLGKCIQALMAIPEKAAVIIVCPAAVKGTWARECHRWRPDLMVVVNIGRNNIHLPARSQVSIVAYGDLPIPTLASRGQWLFPFDCRDIIGIFDEAHYLKNPDANRTMSCRALIQQIGRAWALTGTPMIGMPNDLWGMLSTFDLALEAFKSRKMFVTLFHGEKKTITKPDGSLVTFYVFPPVDPEPTAFDLLRQVMLRRTKREVLPELPAKTYQQIEVAANVEWNPNPCDGEEFELDDGSPWRPSHPDDVPPLKQVSKARARFAEDRIPALIELVEPYEETWEIGVPLADKVPLVVFSAHRAPVLALGGRPGWGIITGDMAPFLRDSIIAAFEGKLLHGLALTIGAGGVGVNGLQNCAWHALFVDLSYNPSDNEQAEDRLCRMGQTRGVVIKHMVSDHPLDRWMMRVLRPKERRIEVVVGR